MILYCHKYIGEELAYIELVYLRGTEAAQCIEVSQEIHFLNSILIFFSVM